MTSASCAARIEKRLNRTEGVTATVNYATEKAKVLFPESMTPDELIASVEKPAGGSAVTWSIRVPQPDCVVQEWRISPRRPAPPADR
jgi:Cu+-exporting ATPase